MNCLAVEEGMAVDSTRSKTLIARGGENLILCVKLTKQFD